MKKAFDASRSGLDLRREHKTCLARKGEGVESGGSLTRGGSPRECSGGEGSLAKRCAAEKPRTGWPRDMVGGVVVAATEGEPKPSDRRAVLPSRPPPTRRREFSGKYQRDLRNVGIMVAQLRVIGLGSWTSFRKKWSTTEFQVRVTDPPQPP